MAHVFISYSSKSKDLVTILAQDLETLGYEIWFDHKLTGGKEWWDQILENIRKCDLFIFALTPDALESTPCQLEYGYAFELKKNILPILVANGVTVNQLPLELSKIQYVDYRSQEKSAALKLMNSLNNLPPRFPLPDPLPIPPEAPISDLGHLRKQIDSAVNITLDEQAALVFKLKGHLQSGEDTEDVVSLLKRLQKRPDLFASIDKEINQILSSSRAGSSFKQIFDRSPKNTPKPSKQEPSPNQAKTSEPEQPQHRTTSRMSRQNLTKVLFIIVSAIICVLIPNLTSILLSGRDLHYYYDQGYDFTSGLTLGLFIASLIHGIVSGFIFRALETNPQKAINIRWFVNAAFSGGPLNGFLLRRIEPAIRIFQIVLVAVGWMIAFLIFGKLDPSFSGLFMGITGSIITLGMLIIVRR